MSTTVKRLTVTVTVTVGERQTAHEDEREKQAPQCQMRYLSLFSGLTSHFLASVTVTNPSLLPTNLWLMWRRSPELQTIERLVVKQQNNSQQQQHALYYSKFTDTIKEKASQAIQQGSHAASNAFQKQKSKAITVAREATDSLTHKVQKGSHSVSEATTQVFREKSQQVSNQVKSASDVVRDVSQRAVSKTTDTIKESSKAAAKNASESIRNTSIGAFGNAQETGRKAIRWLWWWSLAAVGVYGIATTVPRELIRYGLEGATKKKDEGNNVNVNEETRKESVEEKPASKRWRLPWGARNSPKEEESSEKKPSGSGDRWWA